ncbi:MAG: 30S ribosomal protein S9 [Planctomycetota bacterium]|nr:30S ribosomal protein S9 [Planctomycetota bacterium]
MWGVGRRKTAVARVRVWMGEGRIAINGRTVEEYFTEEKDRQAVYAPLTVTGALKAYDVGVNVKGGGRTGQADATKLGIARALAKADPSLEQALRDGKFLTRDPRMRERKKYGQPGARKKFQFSKR